MTDKFQMLDQVNAEVLTRLSGEDKAAFKKGLANLGMTDPEARAGLKAAFKRLKPDTTERELDIMVSGEAPENKPEWIQ